MFLVGKQMKKKKTNKQIKLLLLFFSLQHFSFNPNMAKIIHCHSLLSAEQIITMY